MEDLYSRIEALCVERQKNVTEMCREAGVPRGNLTDLKKGRQSGLSAVNMDKIARYFGVSVGYLLGNEQYGKTPAPNEDELINGDIRRHEVMTEEETEIALLYRAASNDDKEVVKTVLRKYKGSRPASFDVKAV